MDTYLAIVSLRVVREYADQPISDESLQRILQAGRATGSSQNRQEWKFYVVRGEEKLTELAESVYAPTNVAGCRVAIGLSATGKNLLDVGRCAQDMALAAWNEGIGSCPNGVRDSEAAARLLGVPEGEKLVTVFSFGYPLQPIRPRDGDVEGILKRIKRKSMEELVVWVD